MSSRELKTLTSDTCVSQNCRWTPTSSKTRIHYISGLQSHPDKITVTVDDTPVPTSVTSVSLTTSHRQTRSTAVHQCQTHWIITHTAGTTHRQTADYYCPTRRYRVYRLYQHCTNMTTSDYRLTSTSAPPPFVSLSAPVGTPAQRYFRNLSLHRSSD